MKFTPRIGTSFYYNGGSPCATKEITAEYYYIDTIYKNTLSEKIIIYSSRTLVESILLTDGMSFCPRGSDPAAEAERLEHDYIREHANHFLEEVYEKIPEARNADEIFY